MPDVRAVKEEGISKGHKLGVIWKDLTVQGVGTDTAINENFGSQFNLPQKIREKRGATPLKTILEGSHGCVKPGEMLLVVGRPDPTLPAGWPAALLMAAVWVAYGNPALVRQTKRTDRSCKGSRIPRLAATAHKNGAFRTSLFLLANDSFVGIL
jgi:hypothetical protein